MNAAARPPRVVVTRPAAQAGDWLRRLHAAGVDAGALPLIEIFAARDRGAAVAAWQGLATRRLVFFVSPNAVLHFFAARPAKMAWPAGVVAAAPGPGSAEALRQVGVPAAQIVEPAADSASFDSEAVWLRLREVADERDWRGTRALIVRGDGGRDWLAERLAEAGAEVDTLSAYRRAAPAFDGASRVLLDGLVDSVDTLWLFSSSEAIGHLEAAAGVGRLSGARAIATHPRIAARAREAGFGRVAEPAPGFDALVACIQSFQP
ncbi:MAG: uroporphyrinogen-III synthase [Caldimonas sp.]